LARGLAVAPALHTGSTDMARSSIHTRKPCAEIRGPRELTHATAPAVAQAVTRLLCERPGGLSLDLETTKVVDPAGLAVVAQAVDRATALGIRCHVVASGVVFRGLFQTGLLDVVPVAERGGWERDTADVVVEIDDVALAPGRPLIGDGVRLVRPAWDDLRLLDRWAHDADLAGQIGSRLLEQCRHFGPHDPEFVASCLGSATSLLLLVHPAATGTPPVGFVRLHGVHLGQRSAFLETVLGSTRGRRPTWGIEATRLLLRYAVDALGLYRIETKVHASGMVCTDALRRHGFRLEGRLRQARRQAGRRTDILVFGVLEPEIRARRAGSFADLTLWPAAAEASNGHDGAERVLAARRHHGYTASRLVRSSVHLRAVRPAQTAFPRPASAPVGRVTRAED
jgi:RimJ/RimL family protein N-acetyltransferase/anti-anti-sigma regulatory factor